MTIGKGQLYRKKTGREKHFTLSLAGEMGTVLIQLTPIAKFTRSIVTHNLATIKGLQTSV
jgi:hypothetical protein